MTRVELPEGMVTVESLQVNGDHFFILGRDKDNNPMLAACGYNKYGQLGCGDNQDKSTFTRTTLPEGMVTVTSLQVGIDYIFILGCDKDNKPMLAACGYNKHGQLGCGDNQNKNKWTRAKLPEGMVTVDLLQVGINHTFICGHDKDNNLVLAACGDNEYNKLGCGYNDNKNNSTIVVAKPEFQELECGNTDHRRFFKPNLGNDAEDSIHINGNGIPSTPT